MKTSTWTDTARDARKRAANLTPRRGPNPGQFLVIGALGAAAGALAAFLLDPQRGRARRARYADQAAALGRDALRMAGRGRRYLGATLEGRASAWRHRNGDEPMPNDAALADKVESVLFRDPSVPKGSINVNAEHGIVVLRGEVPDAAMRGRLEEAVREIGGVWSVENLLHLPGEPAQTRV